MFIKACFLVSSVVFVFNVVLFCFKQKIFVECGTEAKNTNID